MEATLDGRSSQPASKPCADVRKAAEAKDVTRSVEFHQRIHPAERRDVRDRIVVDDPVAAFQPAIQNPQQGVEMVALCSRNPTKADTPAKREAREKIYNQKYEAKSKSYLEEVRKGAMIEIRGK